MKKEDFQAGLDLLGQPVLPLVSMVQFLYLTGEFATVAEVIEEMPEPIETGYAVYEQPRELLRRHGPTLALLEQLKTDKAMVEQVVDDTGRAVDRMTALTALVGQRVVEAELEPINSLLCGPCGCTLCCTGPDESMAQEFFEIPLQDEETALFAVPVHDNAGTRARLAMDDDPLQLDGVPFYRMAGPGLVHWRNGWSLILPRSSSCPSLAADGRCQVYVDRPLVCRRPQIFCYIVEPTGREREFRFRNSLLAVSDCPYVQLLQDEIAAYAAANELELVIRGNKQ